MIFLNVFWNKLNYICLSIYIYISVFFANTKIGQNLMIMNPVKSPWQTGNS